MTRLAYDTDLSDDQWEILSPTDSDGQNRGSDSEFGHAGGVECDLLLGGQRDQMASDAP